MTLSGRKEIRKRLVLFLFSSLSLVSSSLVFPQSPPEGAEVNVANARTVVVLHGLARSASAMGKLAKALEKEGYHVCNIDYPSTEHDSAELLKRHVLPAIKACKNPDVDEIDFVTHSLGGILVRVLAQQLSEQLSSQELSSQELSSQELSSQELSSQELSSQPLSQQPLSQQQRPLKIRRVVMLAPPNQGSEVVDKLRLFGALEAILGPAVTELGTNEESLPNRLGSVSFELGVIAGNQSINPTSFLVPGDDDGTVSIESTKIAGMRDFILLPASHPFIMRNKEAIRQSIRFLTNGHFDHSDSGVQTESKDRSF